MDRFGHSCRRTGAGAWPDVGAALSFPYNPEHGWRRVPSGATLSGIVRGRRVGAEKWDRGRRPVIRPLSCPLPGVAGSGLGAESGPCGADAARHYNSTGLGAASLRQPLCWPGAGALRGKPAIKTEPRKSRRRPANVLSPGRGDRLAAIGEVGFHHHDDQFVEVGHWLSIRDSFVPWSPSRTSTGRRKRRVDDEILHVEADMARRSCMSRTVGGETEGGDDVVVQYSC